MDLNSSICKPMQTDHYTDITWVISGIHTISVLARPSYSIYVEVFARVFANSWDFLSIVEWNLWISSLSYRPSMLSWTLNKHANCSFLQSAQDLLLVHCETLPFKCKIWHCAIGEGSWTEIAIYCEQHTLWIFHTLACPGAFIN